MGEPDRKIHLMRPPLVVLMNVLFLYGLLFDLVCGPAIRLSISCPIGLLFDSVQLDARVRPQICGLASEFTAETAA